MDAISTVTGLKLLDDMMSKFTVKSPIPEGYASSGNIPPSPEVQKKQEKSYEKFYPNGYKAIDQTIPDTSNPKTVQAAETTQNPVNPDEQDVTKRLTKSFKDAGIYSPEAVAYALATVKHETAGSFKPVREGYYNDQKYGYEPGFTGKSMAKKLGYSGGDNYYGRGYVQLTHDYNYKKYGNEIGVKDLATNPDKALDPEVASKLVAAYFKDRGTADLAKAGKFNEARSTVNPDGNAQLISDYAQEYLKKLKK